MGGYSCWPTERVQEPKKTWGAAVAGFHLKIWVGQGVLLRTSRPGDLKSGGIQQAIKGVMII